MKITQASLRKKIYRKNKEKWGHCVYETPSTEKILLKKSPFLWSLPLFNSRNFYKISKKVQKDFQRRSWKSSWIRQNFPPYFRRVKSKLESFQESSIIRESFLKSFTCFILNFLGEENVSNSYLNQNQLFLTLKKSPLSISRIHLKNSIDTQSKIFLRNSSEYSQAVLFSEYQRILYQRMLHSFKDIKKNFSGHGYYKSKFDSIGRKKFSSNSAKIKNFWQKLGAFIHLEIPTSAIQPSGYVTKLRVCWALNKTNLLTFKERNTVQSLWSSVKLRDQKKSKQGFELIQGLKKILFGLKSEDLESLCFLKIQNQQKKTELLGSFLSKDFYLNPGIFQLKMELKSSFNKLKKEDFFLQETSLYNKKKKENRLIKEVYQSRIFKKRFLNYWWNKDLLNHANVGNCFLLFDFQSPQSSLFLVSLWICTLIFHLSIFFSLFFIPEIRSLLKFQFLVVSKICLSLTIAIYYFCNGFKYWNLRLNFFTSNLLRQGLFLLSLLLQKQNFQLDKRTLKTFRSKYQSFLEKSTLVLKDKDLQKRVLILRSKEDDFFIKRRTLKKNSFLKISKERKKSNLKFIEKTLNSNLFHFFSQEKNTSKKVWMRDFRTSLLFNVYLMKSPTNIAFLRTPSFFEKVKTFYKSCLLIFEDFFKSCLFISEKVKTFYKSCLLNLKDVYKSCLFILETLYKSCLLILQTLYKSCLFIFVKTPYQFVKSREFSLEDFEFQLIEIFSFLDSTSEFTILSIWICVVIKNSFQFFYRCFNLFYNIFYNIFTKIIDFIESVLIIFLKFLEKPAELMIEWTARVFLIEWSSERLAYVPEKFDSDIWNSVYKTSRSLRGFSLPATFLSRRVWYQMEFFLKLINKPDKDLISRQKKGILFWDLWADILMKKAEKANIEIPSVKEERKFFMEKILEDPDWNKESAELEQMTNNPRLFFFRNSVSNKYLFKHSNILLKGKEKNRKFSFNNQSVSRWDFHQDWIYKKKATDFFLDIHPPRSFSSHLKFSELSHQPIATFVCQIYSGIFSKQAAKNILIIGPSGVGKTLFVQAMAGETELQMITEHSQKYSLVSRGVAVGMKLLKNRFESISFCTPCFLLMEDIHLIGEKRPIVLSDDENAKAIDINAGYEPDEAHETNKVIYKLSRHSISHYKKPFRGDYSELIPTNQFCFDLFLGVSAPRTRHDLRRPSHPFAIDSIQSQLDKHTEQLKISSNFEKFRIDSVPKKLVSHLQFSSKKNDFSPPSTSPFTIIALKEQQKFKPKRVAEQMPWNTFFGDQIMPMPKTAYSVRTKVALLAEIASTHFAVKLDMITDLLVLIDNVRAFRGLVVFGSTHMPHLLDPALRRPGRFDETITFPSIPNLLTRWEIVKTSISHFSKTLDCLDYSVLCKNLYENQLSDFVSSAKYSLLNQSLLNKEAFFSKNTNLDLMRLINFDNSSAHLSFSKFLTNSIFENRKTKIYFQNSQFGNFSYIDLKNRKISDLNSAFKILLQKSPCNLLKVRDFDFSTVQKKSNHSFQSTQSKSLLNLLRRVTFYSVIPSGPSNVLAMTYFHVSKLLLQTNFLMDPTSFGLVLFSPRVFELSENSVSQTFKLLFSSSSDLGSEFLRLFAGKIGEVFVFSSVKRNLPLSNFQNFFKFDSLTNSQFLSNSFYSFYGIDEIWRSATSLAFSILQKRYFYSKNLLVSRSLYFENFSSLKEVPSSPSSFCLSPGKRYENFRRVEKDFQKKSSFSLSEKIGLIQDYRISRKLNNKSVQELFSFPRDLQDLSGQKLLNKDFNFNKRIYTRFSASTRELIPIHSSTVSVTASNSYYRKRILARHRFCGENDWWNGHLEEMNLEAIFLSDVDWRYRFRESLGDVIIDFPDTEQYYNPRSRRWMLSSGYWADWNSFEKVFNEEIYSHFIRESFHKAFNFLENHREILDHFAYKLLKNGFLKEIDLITLFSRFFCFFSCFFSKEKKRKTNKKINKTLKFFK